MCEKKPFLTAEWRYLAMLNYPVEGKLLEPLVPAGTMLDTYQEKAYASIVGFLFLKTRLFGMTVPFHQSFEEVNLRFYVRRFADGEWRRAVVFIKEVVPKFAVAAVARMVYNENYVSLPMRHRLETDATGSLVSVEYGWQFDQQWQALKVKLSGQPAEPAPGSFEEFITEHYWGCVAQKDGSCMEYQVEHPRWRIWRTTEAMLDCDPALFGKQFAPALLRAPNSAFLADGSVVTVFKGART